MVPGAITRILRRRHTVRRWQLCVDRDGDYVEKINMRCEAEVSSFNLMYNLCMYYEKQKSYDKTELTFQPTLVRVCACERAVLLYSPVCGVCIVSYCCPIRGVPNHPLHLYLRIIGIIVISTYLGCIRLPISFLTVYDC